MKTVILATLALSFVTSAAHASLKSTEPQNQALLKSLKPFKGLEKVGSSEDKQSETLLEIFTKIQNEGRKSNIGLSRATHAKGLCYNASVKIYSSDELAKSGSRADLIPRLQKGVFATSGTLPAWVRFANAKGDRFADTAGDVRGFSMSLDTTGRTTALNGDAAQDFMMNSSPMFAVKNITEFTELMKAARLAQKDFSYFLNPLYIPAVLRAKNLLDRYERNDTLSYATENYWSNLAYSHGVNKDGTAQEVVKYKVTPCDGLGDRHESSNGKAANYLALDIDERAAKGEVCFNLQAQLFDQKALIANGLHTDWTATDWIENGGELWDETVLPFHTIAKITVSKRLACENLGVNTLLHSTRANQPLGSIARVRARVEENSRSRRTQVP